MHLSYETDDAFALTFSRHCFNNFKSLFISVTLNEVFTFRNGYDIINKVESVKVVGGGDCPEYAAAGIIKGS